MLRLALFFCFVKINSAKIINLPQFYNDNGVEQGIEEMVYRIKLATNGDPLWILKLNNDFDSVRLRAGTEEEIEEFYSYVGPLIRRHEHRRILETLVRVKKDNPSKPDEPSKYSMDEEKEESKEVNFDDTQRNIFKLINKFAMTSNTEPIPELSENDEDGPSVSIFFKGPYTSLMVELGDNQWQYFISPPSPLPSWFYKDHTDFIRDGQTVYVELPEDIKELLYEKLLHMLQMYLSFPV